MNNYILLLLLAAMIVFMWWSSRSRKKQIQKMEQEMIAEIGGQPPLADATDSQAEETADAEETTEQDSNVLGLGEMNSGVSSAEDLDEQQK